jgi:uncharacterized membrane protein (Fun14 family)
MLGEQLGFGGLCGAVVGYTAKKAAKMAAFILGLTFILIQVLGHYHFITPNWGHIEHVGQSALDNAQGPMAKLMGVLTENVPFGGAFIIGFAWGLKMG